MLAIVAARRAADGLAAGSRLASAQDEPDAVILCSLLLVNHAAADDAPALRTILSSWTKAHGLTGLIDLVAETVARIDDVERQLVVA
jgi:hypothetical protein